MSESLNEKFVFDRQLWVPLAQVYTSHAHLRLEFMVRARIVTWKSSEQEGNDSLSS